MGSADKKFETLPTPNPAEVMIRVWQDANQVDPTNIPTLYQTYKASPLPSKPKVEKFGDYVYVDMSKEGDDLWFYFGKAKTSVEKNTPFRSYPGTRNYTWPAVLEDLYAVQTLTFPQTTNTGTTVESTPSIFPRYRYRPQVPYNSLIKVEQFISPTPWNPQDLIHPQPVPTDVNGSYVGVNMHFERCLHDTMKFAEKVPGATIIYGVGSVNPPPNRNTNGTQIFPATNFLDWGEFYIEDTVTIVNGMYIRERVTIYPPPVPEPVFA